MFRYVHTNLIARDPEKLIEFYKTVLKCQSIGETRDLKGEWLDHMTGISGAHIRGEHLLLPGYGTDRPTLEIFSYDKLEDTPAGSINRCGFAHLAFEVDDVQETLNRVIEAGGGQYGELVNAVYENGRKAVFVYASDPEGNIIELQSWQIIKPEEMHHD